MNKLIISELQDHFSWKKVFALFFWINDLLISNDE